MGDFESLAHVRCECKYHVVFIPKFRRKVLYGRMRQGVGKILRDLCEQKGIELLEGHAMLDHVQMCLSIPPKYSVAYTVGFLKGKSAVRIHRELLRERRMTGLHFWAVGYWVSTSASPHLWGASQSHALFGFAESRERRCGVSVSVLDLRAYAEELAKLEPGIHLAQERLPG